jgi:hypothetical protein
MDSQSTQETIKDTINQTSHYHESTTTNFGH